MLAECGTELIGARAEVIEKAESRELFRQAMENIGLKVPQSAIAHNMDDVRRIGSSMPFPMIIRPAFTLGGTGGGIAYNMEDLEEIAGDGLTASPVSEVMIEQSVIGWKEFEMEVMRDTADNCVIVCSIENVDAMGVHTRRLHHRGPGADPHGPRISEDARRLPRHHARNRCGDRRIERAVRRQSR